MADGAAAPFPSESEWLDLPMPEGFEPIVLENEGDGPSSTAEDASSFVSRVMSARREEHELDGAIHALDEQLPKALLQEFAAPPIRDTFVAETVARLQQDRQQRWQEMLARHVAPDPSPQFVARTLQALQDDETTRSSAGSSAESSAGSSAESSAGRTTANVAGMAEGTSTGAKSTGAAPNKLQHLQGGGEPMSLRSAAGGSRPVVFGLLAAAAGLLLWLAIDSGRQQRSLEERLVDGVSLASARSTATTPLAALSAVLAKQHEPDALFDEPVDGLWLLESDEEEVR